MTDHEPNNQDQPVTKSELDKALAATEGRIEQLVSIAKSDLEQLPAEQTFVILGAVEMVERRDSPLWRLDGRYSDGGAGLNGTCAFARSNDGGLPLRL